MGRTLSATAHEGGACVMECRLKGCLVGLSLGGMTCGNTRGVRVTGVTGDSWAVPPRQSFIESASVEWGGVRVKGRTSGAVARGSLWRVSGRGGDSWAAPFQQWFMRNASKG